MDAILGRVKAPGIKPHTFLFVAPDSDQQLKLGEFIIYPVSIDGFEEPVLSRIVERQPLRLYPDSFLASPEIDPNLVAQTLGYSGSRSEVFELTAEIIGYYDEGMRDFINPRVSPRVGTPIFIAPNAYLSNVLSRVKSDTIGGANVGWLSSRSQNEVPIAIDVNAAVSTHLAIIASTGAGKSYTASVLIEEMLRANNRAAVLIIDPHGEYNTLDEIANRPELKGDNYQPRAEIKKPGAVKIRVGTLTQTDLRYLLPNVSERMEYVLGRAFNKAEEHSRKRTEKYRDRWTLADLLSSVKAVGQSDDDNDDDSSDKYKGTADALDWRLKSVVKTGEGHVFDDQMQTRLTDILQPGLCTVMQLNQIEPREQQVIVASLLRRIYQARLKTTRDEVDSDDDYYLPYPVFVLIEEAHNFAPEGANIVSTGILKQILAEGRKFGIGVGLISQRPGKLDADVLSQCNTQFLLRIVNPVDQARVAQSVESVGRELLAELPALNKGQAIISGVAVNTPMICQIRPRYTPHGGESAKASDEWVRYSQQGFQAAQRNQALPTSRKTSSDLLKK